MASEARGSRDASDRPQPLDHGRHVAVPGERLDDEASSFAPHGLALGTRHLDCLADPRDERVDRAGLDENRGATAPFRPGGRRDLSRPPALEHPADLVYEINMLRCIFCGYCEDACPTEAIVLGDNYELSFYDRRNAIYPKEMLLEPVTSEAHTTPMKTEPGKFIRSIPVMQDPQD